MNTATLPIASTSVPPASAPRNSNMSPRTRAMLEDPILPLLLRLSWPNVLVMLAQAGTGLIETWFVARLGIDALGGMALVFPCVMLMQMLSAGALGGGISSAIARALGAGRTEDADALVLHAVLINAALGLFFSVLVIGLGPRLYLALGGSGGTLQAALVYSNVVFAGNVLLWVMNGLASAIRGSGNMLVPGLVICGGAIALLPLSPLLIFGLGGWSGLGVAGGGWALVVYYAVGTAVLGWYAVSGRSLARLRLAPLRWPLFRDILSVGALGSLSSIQTNLTIAVTTAMVGGFAGAEAVAGYGTGARLEYLLVPLVFGIGAPLVTMVGTNMGAGQRERALRVALVGSAIAFGLTEAIGIAAALWPAAWLHLFATDAGMVAAGSAYLRVVGPCYGFFGLGLALYFASQGAGRLFWPLTAGLARMVIALACGWLALRATGSLTALFACVGLGMVVNGLLVAWAVRGGAWFRK